MPNLVVGQAMEAHHWPEFGSLCRRQFLCHSIARICADGGVIRYRRTDMSQKCHEVPPAVRRTLK